MTTNRPTLAELSKTLAGHRVKIADGSAEAEMLRQKLRAATTSLDGLAETVADVKDEFDAWDVQRACITQLGERIDGLVKRVMSLEYPTAQPSGESEPRSTYTCCSSVSPPSGDDANPPECEACGRNDSDRVNVCCSCYDSMLATTKRAESAQPSGGSRLWHIKLDRVGNWQISGPTNPDDVLDGVGYESLDEGIRKVLGKDASGDVGGPAPCTSRRGHKWEARYGAVTLEDFERVKASAWETTDLLHRLSPYLGDICVRCGAERKGLVK